MNGQELISALNTLLKEQDVTLSQFAFGDYDDTFYLSIQSKLGEYEEEFNDRLDSGDHDTWQMVWHFKDHNLYLSLFGEYSSEGGTSFDYAKFVEVKPVEVKITRYEQVK